MTGLLRATLPLEGLVGRALLRMGNGPHGSRVAVKGSTVPTSKAPQILPESLTAHGHRVQTAKGTRSNTELKTSARSLSKTSARLSPWAESARSPAEQGGLSRVLAEWIFVRWYTGSESHLT